MAPYKNYFEENLTQFKISSSNPNQATALCPHQGHNDTNPSFSCNTETGLWYCHGCGERGNFQQFRKIIQGTERSKNSVAPTLQATHQTKPSSSHIAYDYHSQDGALLYQIRRYEPKDFRAFHLKGKDWVSKLGGLKTVPYNLPGIKDEELVFITEGEKDADSLIKLDLAATTNPFGALKWKPSYSEYLKGKSVVIIPDQDEAGQKHAKLVSESVIKVAKEVKILNLPQGKDVTEWLENGGDTEQLLGFLERNENIEKVKKPTRTELQNLKRRHQRVWPKISEAAFHGLAGKITKSIEPYTEADPVAVLINLVVAFGNCVGINPHFTVEHQKHALKIFACLVGKSAKGRKGTSWSTIEYLLSRADTTWNSRIIKSALSSGEGIIHHLRDDVKNEELSPSNELSESSDSSLAKDDEQEVSEQIPSLYIQDKRLLAIEEEFATPLKRIHREGNSLSGIMRNAWDSDRLRTLTRNDPLKASHTHISILAHVTIQDLLKHLNATEIANGFANRFLWVMTRRSKEIPNPTGMPKHLLVILGNKLSEAIKVAKNRYKIERDPEAEALWAKEYSDLSRERYGLTGSILGRAEAQVMRLACIYTLMDKKESVDVAALKAALALWDYCENSVKYIFGNKTGDVVADTILQAIKDKGMMSKEDIYELFNKNKNATERAQAIDILLNQGLVEEIVDHDTDGRPKTIYKLTNEKQSTTE